MSQMPEGEFDIRGTRACGWNHEKTVNVTGRVSWHVRRAGVTDGNSILQTMMVLDNAPEANTSDAVHMPRDVASLVIEGTYDGRLELVNRLIDAWPVLEGFQLFPVAEPESESGA